MDKGKTAQELYTESINDDGILLKNLPAIRSLCGITVGDMARLLGCTMQRYSAIEGDYYKFATKYHYLAIRYILEEILF